MDDLADRAGVDTGEDLFCPECHYNLRGIDSERCPECGVTIDRAALAALGASRIPWTHRRRIGRVRAYVRTLWMVIARPGLLGAQSARPVSYPDARMFRVVTVALAYLPFLVLGIFWGWNGKTVHGPCAPFLNRPGDLALTLIAGLTGLACATGVQAWFASPRCLPVVQQNRAVAIIQYACAPLVMLALSPAIAMAVLWLADHPSAMGWDEFSSQGQEDVLRLLLRSSLGMMAGSLIAWWWCALALLRFAATASWLRVAVVAFCLPLLWLLLPLAWLAGLHVVVSTLVVLVESLRL